MNDVACFWSNAISSVRYLSNIVVSCQHTTPSLPKCIICPTHDVCDLPILIWQTFPITAILPSISAVVFRVLPVCSQSAECCFAPSMGIKGKYFLIVSEQSGLALDVAGAGTSLGTKVLMWKKQGGKARRWQSGVVRTRRHWHHSQQVQPRSTNRTGAPRPLHDNPFIGIIPCPWSGSFPKVNHFFLNEKTLHSERSRWSVHCFSRHPVHSQIQIHRRDRMISLAAAIQVINVAFIGLSTTF